MTGNPDPRAKLSREVVDPYSPDAGRFLLKAEHIARYWFAKNHLQRTTENRQPIVFDVGCGTGYGTAILTEAASKVYGIDRSAEYLGIASRMYSRKNAEFIQINLDTSSIAAEIRKRGIGKPDAVVALEVLEHLENPEKCVKDISETINPGALFVYSVPNTKFDPQKEGAPSNKFHKRLFTQKEAAALATENGFEIVGVYGQPLANVIVRYLKPVAHLLNRFALSSASRFTRLTRIFAYPTKMLVPLSYSFIVVSRKI